MSVEITFTVATAADAKRLIDAVPSDVKLIDAPTSARAIRRPAPQRGKFPRPSANAPIADLKKAVDWVVTAQDTRVRNRHAIDLHGILDRRLTATPKDPQLQTLLNRLLKDVFNINPAPGH